MDLEKNVLLEKILDSMVKTNYHEFLWISITTYYLSFFLYVGKSLIHPNQVPICNEVFSPSLVELQHARRLVEAFDCAQAQGKGVAVLDNKLVEHLHYLQAKDLINRSDSISMPYTS